MLSVPSSLVPTPSALICLLWVQLLHWSFGNAAFAVKTVQLRLRLDGEVQCVGLSL
jgi:hypothetical protein